MTDGQNKLNKVTKLLSGEISDYVGNKKDFENVSRVFLKQLLKDISKSLLKRGMEVAESKIAYSNGGPEDAGEPSLLFMAGGSGLAILIRGQSEYPLLYRRISSIRDRSGDYVVAASDIYEDIMIEITQTALALVG